MSLAGVYGCWTLSPQYVLASGHNFHVVRIHTATHPAEVVDGEPLGNRTDE